MRRLIVAILVVSASLPLVGSSVAVAVPARTPHSTSLQAGYLFPIGPRHTLSTRFVAPAIDCGVPNASVTFGVGVANSQTGRGARIEVDGDCRGSQLSYRAFFKESDSARRSHLGHRVEPGDLITLDITGSGAGVIGDVTDETAGWSEGLDARFGVIPDTGSVVARSRRSPDAIRPLAQFSRVHFTQTRIDYKPVVGPLEQVTMRAGGVEKAKPSEFEVQTGDFVVVWLHQ